MKNFSVGPLAFSGRPLMLASVTSVDEARVCLAAGADIIDAKNPHNGALGALDFATVRAIAAATRPIGRPVSATIGDLACEPAEVGAAFAAMADTGVDYVKVGFFPGGDASAVIADLAERNTGAARLVGVLLADCAPDFGLIGQMAEAGFSGVLIDTADKTAGALPECMSRAQLSQFVRIAHARGLFAGLAGSLRIGDVAALASLEADILGFRGALCLDSRRTFAIDGELVELIRARIDELSPAAARAAVEPAGANRNSMKELRR